MNFLQIPVICGIAVDWTSLQDSLQIFAYINDGRPYPRYRQLSQRTHLI
jgi:hypothetical protein